MSPDASCVKGPSRSFTVNKQCLKLCLVFCSYGCYSSGRLAPWAPGALPGLVDLGSSETEPGFRTVDWAGGWPASFLPAPPRQGLKALPPPPRPPTPCARMESCDAFSQLLEAAPAPGDVTGCTGPPHPPPLCLHCQGGAARIPDYTGELSDTEALSSPTLAPNTVTSKFSIVQV